MDVSRLEELLLLWEEKRDGGECVSAQELCVDCPDLVAELERRIRLLLAFEPIANPEACPAAPETFPAIPGFRMLRKVGTGGMGTVYLAEEEALQREVAIKVLQPGRAFLMPDERQSFVHLFEKEARTLAKLKHEAIVPIHQARLYGTTPYFVMEYLPHTLSQTDQQDRLRRAGPAAVARFMATVARAVHCAHAQEVLHRDLKPANILLDKRGAPKVCDFGLAKLVSEMDGHSEASRQLPEQYIFQADTDDTAGWTIADNQPGTAPYMAPEQLEPGCGRVQPATDIWALGVILYELLAGQRPFAGRTRAELHEPVCRGALVPPRKVNRAITPVLDRIVCRCLEKQPHRRFTTAQDLAEALEKTFQPHRWLPWLLGATASLIIATLVAITALQPTPSPVVPEPRPPVEPYRDYLHDVSATLKKLEAGETVELVKPNRLPPHYVREDGGGTSLLANDDGLEIFSTSLGIIEFLPRVPWPQYDLIVEMRQHQVFVSRFFHCGPYCEGAHFDTSKGQRHFLPTVHYCDLDERRTAWFRSLILGLPRGPERKSPYFRAQVSNGRDIPIVLKQPSPVLVASTLGVLQAPTGHLLAGSAMMAGRSQQQRESNWRKIVFKVSPNRVQPRWFPEPDAKKSKPFFATSHIQYRADFTSMRDFPFGDNPLVELKAVPADSLNFNTLGFVIACGKCTIRRMALVPKGPVPRKDQ